VLLRVLKNASHSDSHAWVVLPRAWSVIFGGLAAGQRLTVRKSGELEGGRCFTSTTHLLLSRPSSSRSNFPGLLAS
jgi:hypothetical protein